MFWEPWLLANSIIALAPGPKNDLEALRPPDYSRTLGSATDAALMTLLARGTGFPLWTRIWCTCAHVRGMKSCVLVPLPVRSLVWERLIVLSVFLVHTPTHPPKKIWT